QCALRPDGTLKDALDIVWFNDKDDDTPITSASTGVKRNPIYLFYEAVDFAADGSPGKPGNKHYQCHHGNKKVLTIMKAMNHNLNGTSWLQLILQLILHTPPTEDEIAFASGCKEFAGHNQAQYVKALDARASTITSAFLRQEQATMEPFNSLKFDHLLTEWIVACDQSFDEVEKPEFINMLQKLVSNAQLQSLEGKVSLFLNAWTSSNGIAFLA
ncbi:hypothetical protein F5148DRAFT_954959, partial [Russula earlei]